MLNTPPTPHKAKPVAKAARAKEKVRPPGWVTPSGQGWVVNAVLYGVPFVACFYYLGTQR